MKHAGELFAGNLVHVGDHQKQTLRCCISGGEGTGLERTVDSASGATLRLHLLDKNGLTENVLSACGCPFVDIFSHSRGGGDGIDGGYLREHIGDMGRCLVTITGQEFFFFTHNSLEKQFMLNLTYSRRSKGTCRHNVPYHPAKIRIFHEKHYRHTLKYAKLH